MRTKRDHSEPGTSRRLISAVSFSYVELVLLLGFTQKLPTGVSNPDLRSLNHRVPLDDYFMYSKTQ